MWGCAGKRKEKRSWALESFVDSREEEKEEAGNQGGSASPLA